MEAIAGGVYTVYNQYIKKYTACQVAYIEPPNEVFEKALAVIIALDWVGDEPLKEEELSDIRPLYMDFMYSSRNLRLRNVPLEVPLNYIFVGILSPFSNEPCNAYGSWDIGYEIYRQLRWLDIPEEKRKAFKEAMTSGEYVRIGGVERKKNSHSVTDTNTPFDSAFELKELPCLSEITCEKWHKDLIAFLRENPFIDELTLTNHGQRSIDLRGTSVRKLMLDMTGLEELWLGEETDEIIFQNRGKDACIIHAEDEGSILTLQFSEDYRPHPELKNLLGLYGMGINDFDLDHLSLIHPNLKELRLWGSPGNLKNFSAIAELKELSFFSTYDLFGFEAKEIPTPEQMPCLRRFWMTSLPEDAAKEAKRLWRKKPGVDLSITKPRKPEWLAQNLDNPFRGWDGAEHISTASAKKAANQYRKTRAFLHKLVAQTGEETQKKALEAVSDYTKTFNKMRFIETEERDEIYMALVEILNSLPDNTLDKDALIEKFEELRDF